MFQRWTDLNAADWKKVCHLEAIPGAINLVSFFHFQITTTYQEVKYPEMKSATQFQTHCNDLT